MKNKKVLLVLVAVIFLVALSLYAVFSSYNPDLRSTSVTKNTLSIKPVYINAANNAPKAGSLVMRYNLQYSAGHYLFEGFRDHSLIYDGVAVVKSGAASGKLSNNGLHYIYTVADYNFDAKQQALEKKIVPTDIYVDGQKKLSGFNITLIGITNDGKDFYYYDKPKNSTSDESFLKKNGATISDSVLTDGLVASLSAKGPFTNSHADDKACGGQMDKEYAMSSNGEHEGHICVVQKPDGSFSQELIIDGKKLYESSAIGGLQLTNSGHYSVTDFDANIIVVDGRKVPVADGVQGLAVINSDATHVATLTNKGILIDGVYAEIPKTLATQIADSLTPVYLELVDNILYVYVLTKPDVKYKTYKNEKYGYEFDYPLDWQVKSGFVQATQSETLTLSPRGIDAQIITFGGWASCSDDHIKTLVCIDISDKIKNAPIVFTSAENDNYVDVFRDVVASIRMIK